MPDWLAGRPFAITFAVLFGIVLLRAQATYWAGRGAITGARRTRLSRSMDSPRVAKAIAALNRWGLPVVTVSFLTVGFQTVVNGAAGLSRMRWGRYTAAMVPGCLAWSAIYATAGFAALTAWMRLHGAWKWAAFGAVLLVIAAGVAIALHVRHMRRTRRSRSALSPAAAEAAD